jgi:hypothetical protein
MVVHPNRMGNPAAKAMVDFLRLRFTDDASLS